MQIGTIVGYPLAASIINTWGWEAVFYLQGVLTLIWCIAWFLIMSDKPDDFRWVSKIEINYIRSSIGESKQIQKVGFILYLVIFLKFV